MRRSLFFAFALFACAEETGQTGDDCSLHEDCKSELCVDRKCVSGGGDIDSDGLTNTQEELLGTTAPMWPEESWSDYAKAILSALNRDLPLGRLYTIDDLMAESVAAPRFRTRLVTIFAIVGLVLAAIGIYGVMAYTVSERARELGVRVALGATTRDVMRIVLVEAFALAAAGVVLGVAGAVAATRLMAALLFGVTPTDPATFASIAGLLMATALAGSYVPARRATRIDPMATLRSE